MARPDDQILILVYVRAPYGQLLNYWYCPRFHETSYIMPIVFMSLKAAKVCLLHSVVKFIFNLAPFGAFFCPF